MKSRGLPLELVWKHGCVRKEGEDASGDGLGPHIQLRTSMSSPFYVVLPRFRASPCRRYSNSGQGWKLRRRHRRHGHGQHDQTFSHGETKMLLLQEYFKSITRFLGSSKMTTARARNWPGDDPLTPAESSCLGAARDPVMLLARNAVDMQWTSFITASFGF